MLRWQESTTDYVNSIQDAINDAKAKAEDFNSREKVMNALLCLKPCGPQLLVFSCAMSEFSLINIFNGQPTAFTSSLCIQRDCVSKSPKHWACTQVFGFPPTEYHVLGKVEEELEPFNKLWNMISDFQASRKEWLHGSFLGE